MTLLAVAKLRARSFFSVVRSIRIDGTRFQGSIKGRERRARKETACVTAMRTVNLGSVDVARHSNVGVLLSFFFSFFFSCLSIVYIWKRERERERERERARVKKMTREREREREKNREIEKIRPRSSFDEHVN